jgi:hypothetical protein
MFKFTDPRETINEGLAVLRRKNVSISDEFVTCNKTVIVVTISETSPVNIVYFGEVGRSCLGDSQLPNNTMFCDHSNFGKSPTTMH